MKQTKYIFLLLLTFMIVADVSAQHSKNKKKTTIQKTVKKKKNKVIDQTKKKNNKHIVKKNVKKSISDNKGVIKQTSAVPSIKNKSQIQKKPIIDITTEDAIDTFQTKEVIITSDFKPSLQSAAKINFAAATPLVDSVILPLTYNIPSSNLFFSYQPITIQPLAMPTDSGWNWQNTQRIKVGAGNLNTLLAEGHFSFGDGKKNTTTLLANYLTSTGNEFAQKISRFGLDAQSIIRSNNNIEWTAHALFNSITQYNYGFKPTTLTFTEDELRKTFNKVALEIGLRNYEKNTAGISFQPKLSIYRFTSVNNNAENNLIVDAPITKSFGTHFAFQLKLAADLSNTHFTSNDFDNNLYFLNPAIIYKNDNLKLNLGVQPSWNNNVYSMQPNVSVEAKLKDVKFSIEAGWLGYFLKNSYRSLFDLNPWISNLTSLQNTEIQEQYVGIKGNLGNHIAYNARTSFLKLTNQSIFYNDFQDGKSFVTAFEPKMEAVKIHGELKYAMQETFSLMSAVNLTQYTVLSSDNKPWGLVPFEVSGGALWKPLKDLHIKADIFYREGSLYRTSSISSQSNRLPATVDLNLGAEIGIVKNLNMWLQMNNLFNNKYQRWNQYSVFGFNVMAGVVYSFK